LEEQATLPVVLKIGHAVLSQYGHKNLHFCYRPSGNVGIRLISDGRVAPGGGKYN
jgi:hypothetical protein